MGRKEWDEQYEAVRFDDEAHADDQSERIDQQRDLVHTRADGDFPCGLDGTASVHVAVVDDEVTCPDCRVDVQRRVHLKREVVRTSAALCFFFSSIGRARLEHVESLRRAVNGADLSAIGAVATDVALLADIYATGAREQERVNAFLRAVDAAGLRRSKDADPWAAVDRLNAEGHSEPF